MTQVGSFSYALPPAVAIACGLAIIAVVAKWAPSSRSRRAFIMMVLGLVFWGAIILGMRVSTDTSVALAWDRWVGVAVIGLFLGFYHFSLEYGSVFGPRRALVAGYVALAFFAVLAPSRLLIEDIRVEEYGYAPVPGPLAVPASLTAVALLFAGVYVLMRRYRATSSYEERNRLLHLILGAALPFVGALLDVFSNLPPVGIWTNILFCGTTAVALLEYRLLDIPHVARRTLTYLVLGVMVAVPYVLGVLAVQRLLGGRFDSLWSVVLSVLVLAVLLRPLYSFAQDLVDRLFYRDRYDALRALEQFGRELQYTVDLQAQSARLSRLVSDALRASCTCLFLPNSRRTEYLLVHCEGLALDTEGRSVSSRSPLMSWFAERPRILAHRMLDIEPRLQSLPKQERDLIDAIKADLLVPIASRDGQLSGLLILGRKRSQGEYSGDDRRLLEALGRQLALSLENARPMGTRFAAAGTSRFGSTACAIASSSSARTRPSASSIAPHERTSASGSGTCARPCWVATSSPPHASSPKIGVVRIEARVLLVASASGIMKWWRRLSATPAVNSH
ncbi:histidine kinase N-terminal 7TM domain-containing protein [Chloroflexota bacterium]